MARRLSHWLRLWLLVGLLPLAQSAHAQDERCFPETGICISGEIREYWEQNGGLAVFGFPITPQHAEMNLDLLKSVPTQWFERTRLEIHVDQVKPYNILLGRLGDEGLWQTGRLPEPPAPAQAGCHYFQETGQSVCDQAQGVGFRTYWESHGLQFDADPDVSDAESLALFGFPLSAPKLETNAAGDAVLTQWFERARFEWHPNNPDKYKVLLGLLGRETHISAVHRPNPDLKGELFINRFLDYEQGTYNNLYRFDASGATTSHLSINTATMIAISPHGDQIAGNQCRSIVGLCVSAMSGDNARKLVDDDSVQVWDWSPDGMKLAYTSSQDTPQRRGMRVYDLLNNTDTLIFAGEAGRMPINASWAADSRQLAFQLTYGGQGIMRANADGSDAQFIAPQGRLPQWSPDGQFIVYITTSAGIGELARYTLKDGTTSTLTNLNQVLDEPRWSPDSTKIAFYTKPEPLESFSDSQLMTISPDGKQLKNYQPDYLDPPYTQYTIKEYLWSPDSRQLAVLSYFSNQGFGSVGLHAISIESGQYQFMTNFWFDVYENQRYLEAWKP